MKENRQGCLSHLIRAETGGLHKGMCSPVSTKKRRLSASFLFGGPEGIRTLGLRDANAALSQLSHGPISVQTSNSAHL